MDVFMNFLQTVSNIVWGPAMLVLLIGTGVYLTIGLRFFTFRHIFTAFRMLKRGCASSAEKGELSPFNALMTALAGTIGTGSIVGVATAIMAGGPGALFWMWCTALVGMATKFAEILLAVHFREVTPTGNIVGGAMYFIRNGLGRRWQWLGTAFACFTAITCFGTGNAVQANAISGVLQEALHIPAWMTAVVLFLLVAAVILGGIRRIGNVAGRIVPVMVFVYIVAALVILALNIGHVPAMIALVVKQAFTPTAATGGFAGASVMMAIRYGMARGVFANEAGLGSGPIAHATATATPVRQATIGMLDVFVTTMIVCSMTGFAILVTGQWTEAGIQGASLTAQAFESALPGVGALIVALSLVLFAFTTILGWCVYGERCAIYLFGDKILRPFRVLYTIVVPLGALTQLDLVWMLADVFNALMAAPNLIGVLLLSPVVFKMAREAEAERFYEK
ncbi:MAG: sodium:alanine symporter family protein [Desulfovibrionaceae bacterium]|nr:sodium:alanine symporter family protein [Desulfovibrionaceae bacterium]